MDPKPSQYYEPMDIDGTSTTKFIRRLPLTDSEKQCRRDNKLCMYCGNLGHHVKDCKICPHTNLNGNKSVNDKTDSKNSSTQYQ